MTSPKKRETEIRFLLLQARLADDPMREHEHRCFADRTGLPLENVVCHDLRDGPPTLEELEGYDALSVGGSGDFYVSEGNLPHFEEFLDFLRGVVDLGYPTFASCFGYQALVQALGGEVVHDTESLEVGTYELELTDEGRADPLFGTMPERFMAQLGHKDRAIRHPVGVPNLATSSRSPFQALRVLGKPIWATQFHPELDRQGLEDRLNRYRSYARTMSEGEQEVVVLESPEASSLLVRFLESISKQ